MSLDVLYLTSRCNFACEYCYEHKGSSRADTIFDLTKEQARANVEGIMKRNKDTGEQVVIVLFGGEPTLNWDVCKDAALYAYSINRNVFFCLSTNGWKFRHDDFCADFLRLSRAVNNQIGLDLSFDGVGNFRRKLLNGDSTTEGLYEVLRKIHKYKIRFNLRYTVHTGNYELVDKDLEIFDKCFNPIKYVISYDISNLGENTVENVKNRLRAAYVENRISRPICGVTCDLCNYCNKSTSDISYWSDGNIRTIKHDENVKAFKDF